MNTSEISAACALLDAIADGNANEKTVYDMADDCAALASMAGKVSQRLGDMHSQIADDNNEILRLRQLVRDAYGYVQTLADSPDCVDYDDARSWVQRAAGV